MSKIKKQNKLDERYDEDEYFKKSKKQKYTKTKFRKKSSRWGKKFNKQSDYRKRAKRRK